MKYLSILPLCLLLIACPEPRERIYVGHKYGVGTKVLMKTGDKAVIIEVIPWYRADTNSWYYKDSKPAMPEYTIRVGFVKRTHKTDSLLEGRRTIHTDVTTFKIKEFEIEDIIK